MTDTRALIEELEAAATAERPPRPKGTSDLLARAAAALSDEHYRVDAMHQRAQKAEGRVQKWLAMREVFGSNERAILALEERGAFSIQDLAAQRDEARAALESRID